MQQEDSDSTKFFHVLTVSTHGCGGSPVPCLDWNVEKKEKLFKINQKLEKR